MIIRVTHILSRICEVYVSEDETDPEVFINSDHIVCVERKGKYGNYIHTLGNRSPLMVSDSEADYVVSVLEDLHVAKGNVS